jgi:phosphotriesterase-related protein
MNPPLNRRQFIHATAIAGATAMLTRLGTAATTGADARIMTVRGPIQAADMGLTLPHEHVTTDFLGAEVLPQPRYDRDEAAAIIRAELEALQERGGQTLFECTPAHIGRDVVLLKRLSEATGLNIVTNTGYYGAVGNKFLPKHAHEETADQLATRWLKEWNDGIDGTEVRPGFIKLGVERGKLPPLHRKLVRAAAQVHRKSGLTIFIHTGDGEAALDELELLREEGISPEAFVWVHAQNDAGPIQIEVAKRGGWVSLDGYSLLKRQKALL